MRIKLLMSLSLLGLGLYSPIMASQCPCQSANKTPDPQNKFQHEIFLVCGCGEKGEGSSDEIPADQS